MPAVRHVTLTGTLRRASTAAATGWVVVGVLSSVQAPGSNEVIVEQGEPIHLVGGAFSTLVPVAHDPNLAGTATIEVQVLLDNTRPDMLLFEVDTAATEVDLADVVLLPVADEGPTPGVPWSAVGKPGGVAPLDSAGKVPAIHLPAAGTGRREHWQEIAATVIPIDHDLGYRPASVELYSPDWTTRWLSFGVEQPTTSRIVVTTGLPFRGTVLYG